MDDVKEADAETMRAEMRARIAQARRNHDIAQKTFQRFIDALDEAADRLEAGEFPEKSEKFDVGKIIREFSFALLQAFKEAEKYEKCVLENTGLIADAPLDLDAIRVEIGRRLDRIRDSR